MTLMRSPTIRVAGLERGTAVLASSTCLLFGTGIAVLSRSVTTAVLATGCMIVGLALTLNILPHDR
ncbi:hypothetical protein [Nocardia tengchongensis]|uniref:hypothetical protein n=1 Tax=Nocardia tengchongensis TaxID=2055889 RepID=UPI0036BDD0E0